MWQADNLPGQPVNAQPLLAAIPTFGQTLLMGQLVRSEAVSLIFIGITALATLITTALLLWLGFRLYEREEILLDVAELRRAAADLRKARGRA